MLEKPLICRHKTCRYFRMEFHSFFGSKSYGKVIYAFFVMTYFLLFPLLCKESRCVRLSVYPFDSHWCRQRIVISVLFERRLLFIPDGIQHMYNAIFLYTKISTGKCIIRLKRYLIKRRIETFHQVRLADFFNISHDLSRYMFDFHWFLTSVVSNTKSRSCVTTFNASILKLKEKRTRRRTLWNFLTGTGNVKRVYM